MSNGHGLGRRYAPDARDLRFPMRAVLPAEIAVVSRFYDVGPVLDQGDTPMCVGYASEQFLQSAPIATLDAQSPQEIYREAQKVDEWPGEDYDGTSVRAAAKVLMGWGRLKSYVWAADARDVRDFLITTGTVIMGTNWYQNMFSPTSTGLLRCTGSLAGGHAYLLVGYDAGRNWFRMVNSWGAGWGQGGQAWIAFRDLDKLIARQGEACAAVEQAVAKTDPLVAVQQQIAALSLRVSELEAAQPRVAVEHVPPTAKETA